MHMHGYKYRSKNHPAQPTSPHLFSYKSKIDTMKRDKILAVALIVAVLAVLPKAECQPRRPIILPLPPPVPPRPLCSSQFSLASYACSQLPYSPAHSPPHPSPPSHLSPNDDDESGYKHGHRHGHRRRHGHRHRHRETPEEENCCRWLKEIDDECACELLVRLPIFLARPVHEYTVIVDDSCNVTYTCNGRLRP